MTDPSEFRIRRDHRAEQEAADRRWPAPIAWLLSWFWWFPSVPLDVLARVGYRIRPYDMVADRRRWFWQRRTRCGWSYGYRFGDNGRLEISNPGRRPLFRPGGRARFWLVFAAVVAVSVAVLVWIGGAR